MSWADYQSSAFQAHAAYTIRLWRKTRYSSKPLGRKVHNTPCPPLRNGEIQTLKDILNMLYPAPFRGPATPAGDAPAPPAEVPAPAPLVYCLQGGEAGMDGFQTVLDAGISQEDMQIEEVWASASGLRLRLRMLCPEMLQRVTWLRVMSRPELPPSKMHLMNQMLSMLMQVRWPRPVQRILASRRVAGFRGGSGADP